MFEESRRQQQVGKIIQRFLADIFTIRGMELAGSGAMLTVSYVRMTRDLKIARAYISIFNAEDKQLAMKNIEGNIYSIKKDLGNKIRNKVRNVPELEIYLDDTLDEVMKLEDIFAKIKEERSAKPPNENFSEDDYKA